jgi:hypothetical protein
MRSPVVIGWTTWRIHFPRNLITYLARRSEHIELPIPLTSREYHEESDVYPFLTSATSRPKMGRCPFQASQHPQRPFGLAWWTA